MPRPINILLVRHAVSAANLDNTLYTRLPDAKVPLAPEGAAQARAAGDAVAEWIKAQEQPAGTRIYCSPFQRTRETCVEIEAALKDKGVGYDRIEELALREISYRPVRRVARRGSAQQPFRANMLITRSTSISRRVLRADAAGREPRARWRTG
jgi:bisphosphoglycerate-dependent phosphoglycerate mutase